MFLIYIISLILKKLRQELSNVYGSVDFVMQVLGASFSLTSMIACVDVCVLVSIACVQGLCVRACVHARVCVLFCVCVS